MSKSAGYVRTYPGGTKPIVLTDFFRFRLLSQQMIILRIDARISFWNGLPMKISSHHPLEIANSLPDVQKFSRYAKMIDAAQERPLLKRINRRIGNPWIFPKFAVLCSRAMCQHSLAVSRTYSVNLWKQFQRMASQYFAYGVDPEDFYSYKLFASDAPVRHFPLQQIAPIERFLSRHSPDRGILADKAKFSAKCAQIGLLTIQVIAEFENGKSKILENDFSGDLFSKPAELWCGLGATIWQKTGDGFIDTMLGNKYTKEDLIRKLSIDSLSFPGKRLLQRRQNNHPDLLLIAQSALSTIRMVACRTIDGDIRFLPPVIRVPYGKSAVDNFAQGGLAAPVDIDTGKINGPAIKKDSHLGTATVHRHPDSGVEFLGFQIPYWNDVVQLSRRAHIAFPSLPFIGWDIAVLPNGPVIVEGNVTWDLNLTILPHRISLSDTCFIPICNSHIERELQENPQIYNWRSGNPKERITNSLFVRNLN